MYPRVTLTCDDPSIQHIPFPLLCGENGLFLGRSADGVVTLTNFRLHICQRKSFLNIPLRLIESVESRDLFYLVILCKDATTVRWVRLGQKGVCVHAHARACVCVCACVHAILRNCVGVRYIHVFGVGKGEDRWMCVCVHAHVHMHIMCVCICYVNVCSEFDWEKERVLVFVVGLALPRLFAMCLTKNIASNSNCT